MSYERHLKNSMAKNAKIARISSMFILAFLMVVEIYIGYREFQNYQLNTLLLEKGKKAVASNFLGRTVDKVTDMHDIWFDYYNEELNKTKRATIENQDLQWIKFKHGTAEILYVRQGNNYIEKLYEDVIKEVDPWYIVKQLLLIPLIIGIYLFIWYKAGNI